MTNAAPNAAPNADIAAFSFEQALDELERVVRALESGEGGLQDAIDRYERGAALRRRCEEALRVAETRVERIIADESGAADGSAPMEKM